MVSLNKVILIGNLGRVSREMLDDGGRQAFDTYLNELRSFLGIASGQVSEAARRLAEASRRLYELARPFVIYQKSAAPRMPLSKRVSSFFHAAKVDGRNLP